MSSKDNAVAPIFFGFVELFSCTFDQIAEQFTLLPREHLRKVWASDEWNDTYRDGHLQLKQRYAAGHQQQENKSILLFRMGRIVCFHLLRPSAAQENEWMKEEKTKWKFVFDEWMVSFLAEKERARQLSFFLGGLRAAASRRQPAKKRDERRAVEQTNKIIQFEKEWTNWLFLWLRGVLVGLVVDELWGVMGGATRHCSAQEETSQHQTNKSKESEKNKPINLSGCWWNLIERSESKLNSTKRIDLVCDWSPGPRAKAASEANEINNWNEKRIIDGMRRSGVGQLDYSLLGVMGRRPLCRRRSPFHQISQFDSISSSLPSAPWN